MALPLSSAADTPEPALPAQKAGQKGWFAAVWPVVLIAICAELGISTLNNSALPVYFTRGLHISTQVYGIIMAMFFVSEVLFKSPLGALADRIGRKPVMLSGILITVFTPILLLSMHYNPLSATAVASLIGFGFLRALDGLGEAALWPTLYAYVGDVVEETKRGAAMGVLNLVYMVGIAFSFLAGGFVDDTFGPILTHQATWQHQIHRTLRNAQIKFRTAGHHFRNSLHHLSLPSIHIIHPAAAAAAVPNIVPPNYQPEHYYPSFFLTSVLFAISFIAALFMRGKVRTRPGDANHVPEEAVTWEGFLVVLRNAPQFLLLAFVMFAGIGSIMLLVKKFALDEFHVSETQFGQIVLVPALLIGLCALPAGRLADRWGKARTIQLGFCLAALGLWGIPILHHILRHNLMAGEAAFMGAAMVMGIGSVLSFPAWLAMLTSLSDDRLRGTYFGVVSTAQGVGALVGVLVGTTLYDVHKIDPFIAAAVLVTLGAVLSLLFVREPSARSGPAPVVTTGQ